MFMYTTVQLNERLLAFIMNGSVYQNWYIHLIQFHYEFDQIYKTNLEYGS